MADAQVNRGFTPVRIALDFDGVVRPGHWLDGEKKPHPDLVSYVNKWRTEGHFIFVLTARAVEELEEVHAYLVKHGLPQIPVVQAGPPYHRMREKLNHCYDILIDDSPLLDKAVAHPPCAVCKPRHERHLYRIDKASELPAALEMADLVMP